MEGISPDVNTHRLNVMSNTKPVRQRRRTFTSERNQAIAEEVDKLMAARFIREMQYPDWLSNIVMVKKSNGKWRMCVDLKDLNQACPKDSFHLPRIDLLMDSTAEHELLSILDAFS